MLSVGCYSRVAAALTLGVELTHGAAGSVQQMADCWLLHTSSTVPTSGHSENVLAEGISYYFLLRFLAKYQSSEDRPVDDAFAHCLPAAKRFFEARTGYVEIAREERLERVFFRLPESCLPGGALDKSYPTMFDTEREDPDKKTQDYLDNMLRIVEEEAFLDKVRASPLAFTVNQWDAIKMLTFYYALSLHLVLVLGSWAPEYGLGHLLKGQGISGPASVTSQERWLVAAEDADSGKWNQFFVVTVQPLVESGVKYMCYGNAALCALRYFSFLWARVNLIIIEALSSSGEGDHQEASPSGGTGVDAEEEVKEHLYLDDGDQNLAPPTLAAAESEHSDGGGGSGGVGFLARTQIVLTSPLFLYETFYAGMAAVAVLLNEPLFTTVFWIEVFTFRSSAPVVNAVLSKVMEMFSTLLLGIAIMYIWMVLGIVLFLQNHDEGLCTNMFQCFMTYIFVALRGDGVRDLMPNDVDIPLNVVDSVMADSGHFLIMLLWDFSYNWLFIYILLAIITGIVIDAFGGLRDEKDAAEDDLKNVCFVCSLARFQIDQSGIGFEKHVRTEHNPRWYLFFLIYLSRKPEALLSGPEKVVKAKAWPASGAPSYEWIPRECCDSIQVGEDHDAVAKVEERVGAVEEKVERIHDDMTSSLSRIEDMLAKMASESS